MKIIRANSSHIDELARLFDSYRVFYKQTTDLKSARSFIKDRLAMKDSVIFIAIDDQNSFIGFTQLYPSFSSVSMQRVYILNDLYVSKDSRGKGVGYGLLEKAKDFTRQQGAKGMTLETAVDNPAQYLYERNGWKKDVAVFHYSWIP